MSARNRIFRLLRLRARHIVAVKAAAFFVPAHMMLQVIHMFDVHLSGLMSGTLFRRVLNNEPISLYEFNFLTGLLVNNNIPFDTAFAAGTRKNPASIQLTIHVNPTVTLVIVVALEPGSPVFSPSP